MDVLPPASFGKAPPDVEKLVSLYVTTKRLILRAEEMDPALASNIAIIKEQRDALDHLMRVIGEPFRMPPKGDQYCRDNLDKAIGHIFRAAYDALDSLSVSIKLRIARALEGRSNEAITAALPEYFTKCCKDLDEIDHQIIESREAKDVGAITEPKLDAYMAVIEKASEIRRLCEAAVPGMVDYDRRNRRKGKWTAVGWILLTILSVLLSVWLDRNWPWSHREPIDAAGKPPAAAPHTKVAPATAPAGP